MTQNIRNDVNQIKINSRSTAKPETMPSFGPVLLVGHSGTGKSLVAQALHSELANLNLIESNGEMVNSTLEISSILMNADDNTTVFIDEAQAIGSKVQHI